MDKHFVTKSLPRQCSTRLFISKITSHKGKLGVGKEKRAAIGIVDIGSGHVCLKVPVKHDLAFWGVGSPDLLRIQSSAQLTVLRF